MTHTQERGGGLSDPRADVVVLRVYMLTCGFLLAFERPERVAGAPPPAAATLPTPQVGV